ANVEALLQLSIEGLTVAEQIDDLVAKVGERIHISTYIFEEAPYVASYVHAGKIGVVLSLQGGAPDAQAEVGRNIAMQIAAMTPIAVDEESIDPDVLAKEREIGLELAAKQNKPQAVLDKIAQGYVKKFVNENTLLGQAYVKDNNLSVGQYVRQLDSNIQVLLFFLVALAS
ncbi:MAG: translation elongation factor Ts, partial [Gammaproteobacteria bacterium]|nr:translation elongation factor Ts [Gammaproteobacteria bacterium]